MDYDEIPEFTDRNEDPTAKRRRFSVKPVFKFKIKDLLAMPYDQSLDAFIYNDDYRVSFVMCGGKITDIFRDDSIFAFEVNDGSGSIKCFHKFKKDPETWTEHLVDRVSEMKFLQNTFVQDDDGYHNDSTIFKCRADETLIKKFEDDTRNSIDEVLFWFKNEVLEKMESHEVGDVIHLTGHLLDDESERKINILDFRIVKNELESQDFELEVDYLHKFVYT